MENTLRKNKMINNWLLLIYLAYWIAISLILYSVRGVGFLPQIVSVCMIALCVLRILVKNKTYHVLFAISLILYSIFIGVLILIVFLFFSQTIGTIVIVSLLSTINLVLSLYMLIASRKEL